MKKETAVVTGAPGKIGQAMARAFGKAGYQVVCGYRSREEEARSLAESLRADGIEAWAIQGDLSVAGEAAAFAKTVLSACDTVDVLVNNAGIAQQKLFQEITDADWHRMMAVNLDSAFYVSRAFLPGMISRKKGKIINISSMWGVCGASCEVHYSAAKAGMIGMTKALAQEVGPSGITVNCIAPGVIQTDMLKDFSAEDLQCLTEETPLGRLGTGEDVANLALFLASRGADFVTGQIISVDGGFSL